MLITRTEKGLYCEKGDFYIDPSSAVRRAIITHCHTDHCRPGSKTYLTARSGEPIARIRVGLRPHIEPVDYGKKMQIGEVQVSLHPAGHILGSAQVRIEHKGEVWCVSGDYKTEPDKTCEAFEPVKCHAFVTESTFAHPRYDWKPQSHIFNLMNDWWQLNAMWGKVSLLNAYSLGKAQRLLAGVDASIAPILIHHTVERFIPAYKQAGIEFPSYEILSKESLQRLRSKNPLIIAPPFLKGQEWTDELGEYSTAFVSGWMNGKSSQRRGTFDAGFPLSDHADWNGLLGAIEATGAQNIIVMHGFVKNLVDYLNANGRSSQGWD
jgi:putative mRNA 3-end processing factor